MSEHETSTTRAGNTPAIERATGRVWDDWVAVLSRAGAETAAHSEIAKAALEAMPDGVTNPEWWAQGVAIAYEQHIGVRIPGQSSTGTFHVSASKTLPLDRDGAIDAWAALVGGMENQRGHALEEVRRARTDKRSFWRATVSGAGRIEVAATPKGEDRCSLAVSHEDLANVEHIEPWRTHWKQLLGTVAEHARPSGDERHG